MEQKFDAERVREFVAKIRTAVEVAIIGKTETVELVISSMLCGGHVLFEDFPGLGKTLLARTLAASMNLDFRRITVHDGWSQVRTPFLIHQPRTMVGGHVRHAITPQILIDHLPNGTSYSRDGERGQAGLGIIRR